MCMYMGGAVTLLDVPGGGNRVVFLSFFLNSFIIFTVSLFITKQPMRQWMLKITAYADRLLEDLDDLDWPESLKLNLRARNRSLEDQDDLM